MKYKNGQIIKNKCYNCKCEEFKIYDLKRYKSDESVKVFVWCECLKCGSVDDLILEEV